jgi:hypothetical protein
METTKKFIVKQAKALPYLATEPFQSAPITHKLAKNLVAERATGKTFRNMQMWKTKHEIEVSGSLYLVIISDSGNDCEIRMGSDL